MTVNELKTQLDKAKIPEKMYSLMTGGHPNERMCLVYDDDWQVYYSERGLRTGLRHFETEDEACEYFFRKMMRYADRSAEEYK